MNRYRQIIGRINYWLFLTVIALLPAPQLVLRYACVAWIILWFLEGRWLNISNLQIATFKSHLRSPVPAFRGLVCMETAVGFMGCGSGSLEMADGAVSDLHPAGAGRFMGSE